MLILVISGAMLLVGGIFCHYYTEPFVFWIYPYGVHPFRWFAMPMIIVGVLLMMAGIIVDVLERPQKVSP